jgi:hypothetical protein
MELSGSYTFEAPKQVVWNSLMDPNTLARVMPGCEKLEETGPNEYEGLLKVKIGPVQGEFQGKIKLEEVKSPDSYSMTVDGQGAPGFMKAQGKVRLEENGSHTVLHYDGTAQVGGRLANVGQRLLDSSAKALTRQSLDGLHKQIKAKLVAEAAPAAPVLGANHKPGAATPLPAYAYEEVKAPSEFEFALGVAKNMFEDLVPAEKRPLVLAGLAGLVLFIFMNWWSNMIARKVVKRLRKAR